MSRRNRGTTFVNNVRGPTSALTSFLNERGIRRANPAPVPTPSPPRTPANEQDEEELNGETEASSSSRLTRTARLTRGRTVSSVVGDSANTSVSVDVGGASNEDEDEDEDEEVDLVPLTVTVRATRSTRTRITATSRSSVAATSSVTVATASSSTTKTSSVSASKKRPRKKDASDDSNDEDFHDITGYVSRSKFSHKGRMPQGSNKIEFCFRCRGRFTIKAGTTPAVDEDTGGLLCPNCAGASPASNATPASKPVKRPRRKAQKAEIESQVPSLQDLCIQKIASCIEDVEAFGDISDISLDKICRIICRNRSLTTDTVQLFLDSRNMDLTLYDCTNITADGLRNIAQFCPNLRSLKLKLCGRINDDVMNYYADQLSNLTSLSLVGPILITDAMYIRLFEAVGDRFERFELKSSSRFSIKALEALCEKCPNLTHLRLSDCNLMDDDWLAPIATLKHLTSLRLRNPERDRLTTESIVKLIQAVGTNLEELELKGCTNLEDAVLLDAIRPTCARLQKLNIMDCEEFTTEGVAALFKDWSLNRGLTYLNLENCVMLKDEALTAVTEHSGVTLNTLSIKGMDEITKDALLTLAVCENLTYLDASWCRAMDDEVLEQLVKAAPKLKKVMVWGDHRLTECCPTKQGLTIVGREGDYIDLRFF
ncbi:hypothetical protein BGZ50_004497 [Haplosporangium sp. Z 11]|nr:hypothetical protein BGZ50_004497 [Haplosporangium sp. Z 11]